MPTTRAKRGPYLKNHSVRCVWCEDVFESNHENATTCSQTCRSRLKRFRDWTGLEPENPPGKVTAKYAYRDLILRLLAGERRRRQNELFLATVPANKRDRVADEQHAAEQERRRSG